jgi:hypothetical protein
VDKHTIKSRFESLCYIYEGNQQVKEANDNQLFHRYEPFRMKEDEDIKTMYSRFQSLVSDLQFLNNRYNVSDHVKKII